MAALLSLVHRRSKTGFGIWDLPQKSSTKAKFRPLGLNTDFLGQILDLSGTFSHYFHEIAKKTKTRVVATFPISKYI